MGISFKDHPYLWVNLAHTDQRLLIEKKEQVTSTLTLKNGLILKFLNDGDILQMIEKSPQPLKRNFTDIVSPYDDNTNYQSVELSRIITKTGNVIKTMKDGKKIIYLTNGNIIVKQSQMIITTNNKGQRFKKHVDSDNIEKAEDLPTKTYLDIETRIFFKFRSQCARES